MLLGFLIRVVELGERSVEAGISEPVDQVCTFIHNNIHEELKLEVIATKWHLSLSHFKYKFKKETGITPADFILREKIAAAKKMLMEERPVHDVAYTLAFSSPSYFSTVFKRYTGLTPSGFKEKDHVKYPDSREITNFEEQV